MGTGQTLRIRLLQTLTKIGLKGEYFLVLVSILIGAATGCFAHVFFLLIEHARGLAYGDTEHLGWFAGRGWMLVVLPTIGAVLVGHITYYLAREAKGHGVPEVMDALCRRNGRIQGRVAAAKAVASALTIGSGGSAGTEGPIIQIGAAIGSRVGQFLNVEPRQMGIVVACGISAGIAAIFNAPIAGVLFALEIFLRDFSFRTFSPVVFSSVISCSIMHALKGQDVAIFEVEILRDAGYIFVGIEFPLFLLLGFLCAIASVAFIKALYFTEDLTDRLAFPEALKPALGAVGLGLLGMGYLWVTRTNQMPGFFGNGYPAIQATFSGALQQMSIIALLSLCVLKLLATCLTLGSGGSGGVFAPSLLMGATLGGAFGLLCANIGIVQPASASAYALVGMAAMVAGTTHAPLTAIVMLYEITREPKVILPVMFAAIVATASARFFQRDSIYTLKLRRRGVRIGAVADLTVLRRITVSEVPRKEIPFVHPEDPLQRLFDLANETNAVDFTVVDEHDLYQGMVTGQDVRTALLQPEAVSLLLVGDLVRPAVPTVGLDETLDTVLDKFGTHDVASLPVAKAGDESRVIGVITRHAVLKRYREELERSDD